MKIAVIADIHSNYIALQSALEHIVAWAPDKVIVAGDIVNRGPDPLSCLQLIKEYEDDEILSLKEAKSYYHNLEKSN